MLGESKQEAGQIRKLKRKPPNRAVFLLAR